MVTARSMHHLVTHCAIDDIHENGAILTVTFRYEAFTYKVTLEALYGTRIWAPDFFEEAFRGDQKIDISEVMEAIPNADRFFAAILVGPLQKAHDRWLEYWEENAVDENYELGMNHHMFERSRGI